MTARSNLVAVDASVAVPLLVGSHDQHDPVTQWARGRRLGLSAHALAEVYSVLTRLPGDARVAPEDAVTLIDENFPNVLALPQEVADKVHHLLAASGVAGGATYDGLVALAAREHDVVLATRDARAQSTYAALGVAVEPLVGEGGAALA